MGTTTTHRVAIVGAGNAGIAHLRAFETLGIQIGVVCDSDPLAFERVRELGLAPTARYISDVTDVAQDDQIDIATVCTPDHVHLEPAVVLIRAGKHVLMEKPTVTTWQDIQTLLTIVAEARTDKPGLIVASLEKYLYSPRNIFLRELVRNGKFGKISCAEGSYIWANSRRQIMQSWRSDRRNPYNVVAGGEGVPLLVEK